MTRILLTGTRGALGGYIKQCLQHGKLNGAHELACISRKRFSERGVKNYHCNFLDKDSVEAIIRDFKPQKAFLIAWETTHGTYWHDQINIKWADSTINFAEQFAKHGGEFITFAGTCAEYQWSSEMMVEGVTPEIPHTLYGKEKLRATHHLLNMQKNGKLNANSCRLFFPYSEHENDNRVTSLVVKSLMEDKPIHLRAGDVYRDICHTQRLAEVMCKMSFAGAGGLFNMSLGKPQHLGKFLKQIAKCMGKEHLVSWDEWNGDDKTGSEPRYLYGSNERVKPYLKISENTNDDIEAFVRKTQTRFSI